MSVWRLLFTLAACLCVAGCEYEQIDVEIGHLGKARRDPFLAAQRLLTDLEYTVEAKPLLAIPPAREMTVLAPAAAFTDPGMTKRMMKWVEDGGHLIVFMEGAGAHLNDWGFFGEPVDPARRKKREEMRRKLKEELAKDKDAQMPEDFADELLGGRRIVDAGERELRAAIGVTDVKDEGGSVTGELLERRVTVAMPMRFAMQTPLPEGTALIGSADRAAIAIVERGEGSVTIIADAQPFRNRYIGEGDHAILLWLLVGRQSTSGVWFVSAGKISFFGMLWARGWAAILAFVALIVFWLWRSFPRFGPLMSGQDRARRQFGNHLALAGAYLWRQGESRALIAPLRRTIFTAAERRGIHRDSEDFHSQIAQRAGMSEETVRAVLGAEESASPHQFTHLISHLEKIRKAL